MMHAYPQPRLLLLCNVPKLPAQVEPIFDLGGYVAVSQSLAAQGVVGVAVSASPPPPPRRVIELLGPPEAVGVAMGAALDDKLAEASRRAWVDKNAKLSIGVAATAANDGDDDAPAVQRRGRRLLAAADASSDLRGMPEAPLRLLLLLFFFFFFFFFFFCF